MMPSPSNCLASASSTCERSRYSCSFVIPCSSGSRSDMAMVYAIGFSVSGTNSRRPRSTAMEIGAPSSLAKYEDQSAMLRCFFPSRSQVISKTRRRDALEVDSMKRTLVFLASLALAATLPAAAALDVGAKAPVFTAQASLGGKVFDFDLAAALKKGRSFFISIPRRLPRGARSKRTNSPTRSTIIINSVRRSSECRTTTSIRSIVSR